VSGRSGRYERSMAGMVGAMGVTLLVILAFVVFRAVNREDLDYEPEPVDYLSVVEGIQANQPLEPAYPPELAEGWVATLAGWEQDTVTWKLNLLTDEGRFLGVRQSRRLPVDNLVEQSVDEDAQKGATIQLDGALGGEWTEWSDGSDYALVRETRSEVLLVVGTGSEDEVRDLAASLVVRPVDR